MRSATRLVADLAPCKGLHLTAADGLNKKNFTRVPRFTLKEDLQRQTKSDRHGTRSFVIRDTANQALAWLTV